MATKEKTANDLMDDISRVLRSMPLDQRAEAIVTLHAIAAREFALMVLEHVKPPAVAKRRRVSRSR